MLLHGEQSLEIKSKIPTSGSLVSTGQIVEVSNKGKNAITVLRTETKDRDGRLIFVNKFTNFIRGASGKEVKGPASKSYVVPNRSPDKIVEEKTNEEQAALYRLSGDSNPLHIDPENSAMGGFDKPILHGLCTFGIACKHIVQSFGAGRSSTLKSLKVFDIIHVDIWLTLTRLDSRSMCFQVKRYAPKCGRRATQWFSKFVRWKEMC